MHALGGREGNGNWREEKEFEFLMQMHTSEWVRD